MAEAIRYYHGGPPGLGIILPSERTKAPTLADYGAGAVCRRNRVYVVTSFAAAAMYAALHPSGKGVVYRVEPQGPLEADTDFLGTGEDGVRSYCCLSARVLMCHRLNRADLAVIKRALMEKA